MPARLSGGQQHRVALGRLLLAHCEALLLDEPYTGLDLACGGPDRSGGRARRPAQDPGHPGGARASRGAGLRQPACGDRPGGRAPDRSAGRGGAPACRAAGGRASRVPGFVPVAGPGDAVAGVHPGPGPAGHPPRRGTGARRCGHLMPPGRGAVGGHHAGRRRGWWGRRGWRGRGRRGACRHGDRPARLPGPDGAAGPDAGDPAVDPPRTGTEWRRAGARRRRSELGAG